MTGYVPESEVYDAIEEQLNAYMMEIDFDAAVYVSRLTDAVRRAEHVTDVHIDENAVPEQGIFIASHDTDVPYPVPRACRPHDPYRIGIPERIIRQGRGGSNCPTSVRYHHPENRKP
ncbi:hypothetical protein NXX23_18065 [Bacteroides ovatus]|nr:hypothetical protein [Bacteroides ovatus]